MHGTVPVRVVEGGCHFARQSQGLVDRELSLAREPLAQALALHVGHHVVEQARSLARVEQRQDVRMLEPRGELDFAQEALGTDRRGERGVQHLDRHRATVPEVLGQEHGGHAAATQLAPDRVAAAERGVQLVGEIGHGRPIPPRSL